MKRILLTLTLLMWITVSGAQPQAEQDPLVFASDAQEQRFNALIEELRCLVCQNQNLADSDAPLAHDLRAEIHAMMEAGSSDEEIKQFLISRYGYFVLYRPPVQGNTLVLWFAPGILLAAGALVVIVSIRRRRRLLARTPGGKPG